MLTSFLFFLSWGVSITHPALAFTCGKFLLHIPCWLYIYLGSFSCTSRSGFIFIWGVSLTHPTLALIFCGEFLTPPMLALKKNNSGEFLLHIPCWLHFYAGSFADSSRTGFIYFLSRVFLLHIPCLRYFSLGSFSYTSHTGFIFIWGFSLTHPMLAFCGGSFSYTSHTEC